MSLTLIETDKNVGFDADSIDHHYGRGDGKEICEYCGRTLDPGEKCWEREGSGDIVCDNCVHVVSLEDACDAVEQVASLKNAFEFIFGKSKVKTNDEIVVLHCFDCKRPIESGQDVRWKGHSYCTGCFFKEAD